MNVRARLRTVSRATLLLAALAPAGCLGGGPDDNGVCDPATSRPLAQGELFYGSDPNVALAPFAGRWRGALTWRTGAVTGLDLAVPADPANPVQVYLVCGRPAYTFIERLGTVSTDDGAIMHGGSLYTNAAFYQDGSVEYRGPTEMQRLYGTLGPPATDIVDVSHYVATGLVLTLTWDTPAAGPTAGVLQFHGTLDSNHADSIELGTVAF
jgi:hypothetical protein